MPSFVENRRIENARGEGEQRKDAADDQGRDRPTSDVAGRWQHGRNGPMKEIRGKGPRSQGGAVPIALGPQAISNRA